MQQYRDNPFDDGSATDLQHIPAPHRTGTNFGSRLSLDEYPGTSREATPTPRNYTQLPTAATASATGLPYMASQQYSNLDNGPYTSSPWLEGQQKKSRRSKFIAIGALVTLIGLIAVGVGVGVSVAKSHKGDSDFSSSGGNGSDPVTQTNPDDPSTFVKDPRLIQSFYGIAYTPAGSQLPECGNSLEQVIEDIQLMSQLTTRVRLYGADCNQTALVLEAIKQTKVNMTVFVANYPIPTNSTPYTQQKAYIEEAIQTYGTDNIAGVTVGNEFMLDYLDANEATDPNSAVGNQGAALLIADINDTRSGLEALNLPKTLPVGTADAGAYFNTEVLEDVAYGMSNVHPWFGNVSIDQAADWTYEFFETQNVIPAKNLSNAPQMYIAETGWPTNSSDKSNESNGPSNASVANLQIFLDTFVCQANTNGTKYFFFEFFDEEWKNIQFGGVEGYWGLFTANKTLKSVTIPNCPLN